MLKGLDRYRALCTVDRQTVEKCPWPANLAHQWHTTRARNATSGLLVIPQERTQSAGKLHNCTRALLAARSTHTTLFFQLRGPVRDQMEWSLHFCIGMIHKKVLSV